MSIPTSQIITVAVASILEDFKKKFMELVAAQMQNNPSGPGILQAVQGWVDQTITAVGAGVATLNVLITMPQGQPTQMNGLAATGNPFNGSSGLAAMAGQTPFAQAGGFNAPMQPGAPATGQGLPKNAARSLAEVGRCRVPLHESNMGARCGCSFTNKSFPGVTFYCTADAVKQNANAGFWSCGPHAKRDKFDAKGAGKKSGATSGSMIAASQIQGLRTPTNVSVGFQQNPGLANQLAGTMQQNPLQQNSPFGGAPMQGGNPFMHQVQQQNPLQQGGNPFMQQNPLQQQQQQNPSNPMLSHQLMNSLQQQVGQIQPGQSVPAPSGAGFNFNNMLGQNTAPGFQITPTQTTYSGGNDDDEENSDDDEEDENEEELSSVSNIPKVDNNQLAAALAAAQNAPSSFGGSQVQVANPFGQPPPQAQPIQVANPFGQQPQQQVQPVQVANPFGQQPQQQTQPIQQAPPAAAQPSATDVALLLGQPPQ